MAGHAARGHRASVRRRRRLVFYFLAEQRVDFRELVRGMAREFHTRIELRQIGVRDEAKLLADYGDCGKPVCCNTHMMVMPPVSMRMAKLQKSTLDPTKISGRCGRLKCCLRFEQDVYEEFRANCRRSVRGCSQTRGRAACWPRKSWPGDCWWNSRMAAACPLPPMMC